MKDQPWDLNQTWPVGRKWCHFTNAPNKQIWGPPPKFGVQKHQILTTFRDFRTQHRIFPKRNVASTNQKCQSTMCPLKVHLLSVTSETAEICSVILTHPMEIQHLPSLPGFPHKCHWTQANQILPDVRGHRELTLTIHRKITWPARVIQDRRQLCCNHHTCDMSSYCMFMCHY